ncbi:flagellar hook assembly protein FlgD [uncultured Dechloromonas sp.]|uniref:flagellar hook assembly protein FlgD n=1 Tax=uncultured Dechloromonas sp. TaxID=171719 RepID=UPI0025FAEF22|nr:flagellar hook assembly protein FlgD [uncultured Dechloromonas sp.]
MASSVTNTTTNTAADIFANINGTKKTSSTSTTAEMEDRFLTLLMTQIKNQDPLNPMDNAAVTTQLAQLNTVNGIEKLNATLSQLLSGYNEAQGMQAAGIIGKNVMVAGNSLPLAAGKTAFGGASLAAAADKVTLTIKDASGKLVQSKELGAQEAGIMYFSWDGKDEAGNAMSEGKYTFAIEATAAGKKVDATAMKIGTVSAVTRSKDGFILDMGTLGDVAFKDVQQIL